EEALARYPVLVLSDVECMTEEEAESLMEYVKRGGGLVLTERTSLYDAWRRRRKEPALAPMLKEAPKFEKVRFGAEAGENINVAQSESPGLVVRGSLGNGRFVYLSRLEPVKAFGYRVQDDAINAAHWHLPKNYREFLEAVRYAGKNSFTIDVTASQGLAAEARRSADGRLIIHLINYRLKRTASRVSVRLSGLTASGVRLWTPGEKKPKALKVQKSGKSFRISIGSVRRYAIVEIQ
ncbi:MAG: hypothetical protein KAX80_00135, partial [Planctomycetes bacterium]|nr:hypothetical protein [Planctomycetota bacterium]